MTTNGLLVRDLDGLEVGESFTSPGRTITEADVVSFASLTADWHPQHADASWAAGSRFGQRVAHGMLVLSYSVGLVPLDPSRVVALRGVSDVVFKRPVYIGDTIRVEGRVERVKPLDRETGLVDLNWKILNQSGDVVIRASLTVIWRRTEPPEEPEPAAEPEEEPAAKAQGPELAEVFL
jgi:3-hydroxybutyryl-CoA dehydratase